jgi:hypothetical protein
MRTYAATLRLSLQKKGFCMMLNAAFLDAALRRSVGNPQLLAFAETAIVVRHSVLVAGRNG